MNPQTNQILKFLDPYSSMSYDTAYRML